MCRFETAWILAAALLASTPHTAGIDRHALVARNDPVLCAMDPDSPLFVGNGDHADIPDEATPERVAAQQPHRLHLGRPRLPGRRTWVVRWEGLQRAP